LVKAITPPFAAEYTASPDEQELPPAVLAGGASLLAFSLGPWCR
jgi:hypothetical protein